MQQLRKWFLFGGFFGLVLAIDQVSKQWVINNMAISETRLVIPALHPVFQFTRTVNTGVAFGLGDGNSDLFLILSIVIVVFLTWLLWRTEPQDHLQHISLGMVIGGAIGNIIDRWQYGHVVDFFHVRIPGLVNNVSNFADHFVVLGVILIFVDTYLQDRREKAEAANAQADDPVASSHV